MRKSVAVKWNGMGRPTEEGESPVHMAKAEGEYPEYHAAR